MTSHELSIESIPVRDIFVVGNRHRPLNSGAVETLIESIKSLGGIKTPISVVYDDTLSDPVTGEDCGGFRLIAGNHRLEAAKRLEMENITAIQWPKSTSVIDVEMWEIAENLHRVGLTKEERDEHIRRYAALMEEKAREGKSVVLQNEKQLPPAKVGRPESVITKIAGATGLSVATIWRALNKPSQTPGKASPKQPQTQTDKDFDRLCRIWAGASADTRARFKEWAGLR